MPAVRNVLRTAVADNYRLKSLIAAVVLSDNFRMNVVSPGEPVGSTPATKVAAVPATRTAGEE
jgi:hypothetical protein